MHRGLLAWKMNVMIINILQCNLYELKRQLSKIWGSVKISEVSRFQKTRGYNVL